MPTRIIPRAAFVLLAFLLDSIERLGKAFERILIRRLRAAARSALHRQVGSLAHGIDELAFLADVLDPRAVILGVHGKFRRADLGRRIRGGFEWIADAHRDFVLYLVGPTRRAENVGGSAPAAARAGV